MAFDEAMAGRIRKLMASREGMSERRMFGGVAFMLNGNMACGVTSKDLMVRVGPEAFEEALAQPHARPMDFTGRPMKGMVFVDPPGYASDEGLAAWVERGTAFAGSLPPK